MAVDVARACHNVNMRFWADSDVTIPVRWFFVPRGRPPLPFGTPFHNYDWEVDDRFKGEVTGTVFQGEALDGIRKYGSGKAPVPDPFNGMPCGTEDQWGGDLLIGRDPPLTAASCGCIPPTPASCHLLPAGSCDTYHVQLGDLPFDFRLCVGMRGGVYSLSRQTDGCTWTGQVPASASQAGWALTLTPAGSPASGGMLLKATSFTSLGPAYTWELLSGANWMSTTRPSMLPEIFTNQGIHSPAAAIFPECSIMSQLIGSVSWDAGSDAVPAGYLLCDGSAVSRATYSLLFGRLGLTFGAGDGVTTFNLPDLRDKAPVGSGRLYGTGASGGEATHTLTAAEVPPVPIVVNDPGHFHNFFDGIASALGAVLAKKATTNAAGLTVGLDNATVVSDVSSAVAQTLITATLSGGGQPHNNMQPYVALRPLIYSGV